MSARGASVALLVASGSVVASAQTTYIGFDDSETIVFDTPFGTDYDIDGLVTISRSSSGPAIITGGRFIFTTRFDVLTTISDFGSSAALNGTSSLVNGQGWTAVTGIYIISEDIVL
ncbi:MAG: hypothetical protein AAFR38_00800 [Planctomycetota bacterium]